MIKMILPNVIFLDWDETFNNEKRMKWFCMENSMIDLYKLTKREGVSAKQTGVFI